MNWLLLSCVAGSALGVLLGHAMIAAFQSGRAYLTLRAIERRNRQRWLRFWGTEVLGLTWHEGESERSYRARCNALQGNDANVRRIETARARRDLDPRAS